MPRETEVVEVDLYQETSARIDELEEDPDNIRLEHNPETVDGLSRALEHFGRYDVAPRVWQTADGKLRALAGSGRVRAAKKARQRNRDLTEIPVIRMAEPRDRREKVFLQFAENALRDPLGPVDLGRGFKMLSEEGMTYDSILEELKGRGVLPGNRTRPWVTQMIQLTELAQSVQAMVNRGELSVWHGLQVRLLPLAEQEAVAQRIVRENLSRTDTRHLLMLREGSGSAEVALQHSRDLVGERAAELDAQSNSRPAQPSAGQLHGPIASSWTLPAMTPSGHVPRSKLASLQQIEWYKTAGPEEQELAVEAVTGGHSPAVAAELVQRAVDEAPAASAALRELLIALRRVHDQANLLRDERGTAPAEFARLRLKAVLKALSSG